VTYLTQQYRSGCQCRYHSHQLTWLSTAIWSKGYSYQPERAKKLIEEVRAEAGSIPSITLLSNDNYSDRCNFIASQLSNLGLDIKIEIMQPALLREQMSNSNASFFWATWIADYPDAESYLTMFYGKNTAPPNYTRF
jgi:ABC-type oligopeptide transport system substrate-binding subunit